MTCQECEELAAAYVLDAVTPAERETIEEHILECPDCERAVSELQPVANLLPVSVPAMSPSPLVKENILANVRADALSYRRPQQVQQQQRRGRTQWRQWSQQLVAFAAVLVFALIASLAAWNISLQQQISGLHAQPVTSISYALKGTSSIPDASGQLVYLPKLNVTVLTVHGLPQTNGSHVYQGWLLHCKQPTSVGLLTLQNGVATGSFPGDVKGYDAAAVSLEPGPAASVSTPKGAIVALGSLTSSSAATGCTQ
ncbi:MAG TPA: anti-sigma factor [Ktedonobacteraceae bacterium]|nr:anti-sigma factor [Ktedonobacteraceae bacterium]